MYQILSESQKRSLREQFEAKQEYMVAYNAINVCGERYDDLSPEEIWNEALDVVKEISESPHREWKVKKLYSQLKRRYSTFEDEFGECITRTPKQQEITAMLVLFDVVCMLSLAKHVDPEDAPKHPYYNYMVEIVSFFNDSILFQAMLAVLSHDEEEIENMTGHELREVDYLDGLQDINDDEKDEPMTGTKDDHVRLFVEAMKQMQQGVYCQTPFEPNIKNTYDWYAVCRLAIDIGIITSIEEFIPLIDGDCWRKKPKGYQNFQKYIPAINKNSKYPVWQSGNGYENFYNKFKQIADQTYSIYKAKCEQAKIEPYK